MVSKFKNRLVGTIVLVALSIIILPTVLDSKKKHHQDKFTTIPLVPRSNDSNNLYATSLTVPRLLSQLSKETGKIVKQSSKLTSKRQSMEPLFDTADYSTQTESFSLLETKNMPYTLIQPEPQLVMQPETRPVPKPQLLKIEVQKTSARKFENRPFIKKAPKGQAWVVQLGALKNANKVSSIVTKLRLSGYHVYTSPLMPVQGQITRIFVGPDISKERLQSAFDKLNQLSGLNGKLQSYSIIH